VNRRDVSAAERPCSHPSASVLSASHSCDVSVLVSASAPSLPKKVSLKIRGFKFALPSCAGPSVLLFKLPDDCSFKSIKLKMTQTLYFIYD